ncbi:MAG: LytR C-terminal domain-containing protein [Caulobacterales bacterium]
MNTLVRMAISVMALQAAGCATSDSRWTPISAAAAINADIKPAELSYRAAVAAIDGRDYARALELLQMARAQDSKDDRIYNAFGVVYDKLGRFDLSRRYYAQAQQLAPESATVANNIAYSKVLEALNGKTPVVIAERAHGVSAEHTAILQADLTEIARNMQSPLRKIELRAAQPEASLEQKASLTTTAGAPAQTSSLSVINATGTPQQAEHVRQALVDLKWSAPRNLVRSATLQEKTIVEYPQTRSRAAKALVRTLPNGVAMQLCETECQGLALIVGQDSLAWKLRGQARRSGPGRGA